ncbi:MAG: DUF6133 family protein [Oscillospiraceae bacterium]|nr:MAG: DUF6133 family protein [Oscillospiraceae bacterium]
MSATEGNRGKDRNSVGKQSRASVDTGVKIIISVVVGGVILAGLYALFKTTILPNLNTEIGKMFNYSGT